MKSFHCTACENLVFFENSRCESCGHELAFLPDVGRICALEPRASDATRLVALGVEGPNRYRPCGNALDHAACNWAVPDDDPERLCLACRFNELVPDLSKEADREAWKRIERAKRRLFYSLLALRLPLRTRAADAAHGLAFVFVREAPGIPVTTGHSDGVITLNVAEADAPFREKIRLELGEPYRTLLGHFRHEIGHYYWPLLVGLGGTGAVEAFRERFGDERGDYSEALARHYERGPEGDWRGRFVSAYAAAHPFEDWAETWAHYLHMVDTLDTARSHGLVLHEIAEADGTRRISAHLDIGEFDAAVAAWIPLTVALNDLNRSMGQPDAYPFVLTRSVTAKLRLVHDLVTGIAARSAR